MTKHTPELQFFSIVEHSERRVQLIEEAHVHAGFPSPVEDAYMSQPIDLNKELVDSPATTFLVKVVGNSMIDEGIDQGDMLVVDRSRFSTEKNISVCMLDGEFCLKRIVQREGRIFLLSGNKDYPPIEVQDETELRVWGVVTWVMKKKA
ncbi:MAG: translesion error-prone DNA polymerase V autoproteolytic subunit [Bacteroidales bacterium]|nr:translesion error-prone DNA polymerase V autoproteolytic subunit [Candidatus Physcousia equi]